MAKSGDILDSLNAALPRTEATNLRYSGLDMWSSSDSLQAMLSVQRASIEAVNAALPTIAVAAEAIAERMKIGGRLIYVGAGSSGLLAQVDALELPGTFGFDPDQIRVVIAGGESALKQITGSAEDDIDAAIDAILALNPARKDCMVAVSASGKTPFAVAALKLAHANRCLTVAIANNPVTPLLEVAEHAILVETPPEVIAGSTRMGAGTAQKCVLNLLSTLVALRLGKVHDGLMVNMQVSNEKLRLRAANIVAQAANVDHTTAKFALHRADSQIKPAILLASGASDVAHATQILKNHDGNVRAALAHLGLGPRTAH